MHANNKVNHDINGLGLVILPALSVFQEHFGETYCIDT